MVDGKLLFETGIDNSGFDKGISSLTVAAGTAIGNIAANMVSQISEAVAQIPTQMIAVGSGFEASMSQVAATMGITSAAEEFDVLSNAAKEMGETTKFSASQAGEALNYLALAGYDAEKAVSALPTVLNVAAAGGMELAAASDMITDAMSALGLETSQMSDFADKLAVTAQKSNTSVSQLGEAILTVGGTAKNLAGGVTEMNTVLGILADNGIKGAEGGTALRNIILSLTAPTDKAAEAIDGLGVAVFDNEGKMRGLQDIIYDLNDALGTMTDADKSQVLSDIFNKVDLKSVNALLGTSMERFDELSGYIDNCSGAAADMAQTMDDNLKGDLTIMQSALEGLGIAAYEKFQTPMRTAVQSVTEDVGTLTESLTDGELSNSFDQISDGFGNLAATASEILSNNIIPAAINGLGTIIEYGNEIISVAAGIGAAIVAINITPFIVQFVAGIQTANLQLTLLAAQSGAAAISQTALAGGLTATEIAVGVFTGKITLATAAQAAFNAVLNLNPIVLVATGIAALTAAIVYCATETNRATTATNEYADAMSKVQENSQSYINDSETEIALLKRKVDRYEELRSNLDNLNSNEMAEFLDLADELQDKLPEGTELIDEQTGSYKSLADSINSVIEKMRIQAVLNSKQDAYDLAVSQNFDIDSKLDDLNKQFELWKNPDDTLNIDPEGLFANVSDNDFLNDLAEKTYGISYDELQRTKEYNDSIISEYEDIYRSQYEAATGAKFSYLADYYSKQGKQAYNAMGETTEELQLSQEEMTAKLKEGWQAAEHNYAIGVIGSEEDLIAEKQRIWNEYGDESCTDHWQYYENLVDLQEDYADEAKKAEEKAAREREEAVKAEWTAIEHQNQIGLLSDEDTYKAKLAFIQKYCPEYSDEWYDYYKDVYDYQQAYAEKELDELKNSMDDQIDVVKDGLKDILSEYKSAYKDIQSNIDSYKKKLLSLGDAFEVIENKNGSKTLKVNNLSKQMEEMRKYTEYVKKLKSEDASQGLLEELTSMDAADGMEFAKNLANMSSADFAQINDYYKERDKLAQELAEDLYSPDVSKLNEKLVSDITEQFGMLPEEIQAIGKTSVNAFIAGLDSGDLSDKVDDFVENFFESSKTAVDDIVKNKKDGFSVDLSDMLENTDTYSVGEQLGKDFADGFNSAIGDLTASVQAEQANVTAEYTTKGKSDTSTKSDSQNVERIILENHIKAELDVDGEKMAEKVIEKTETINRRKGK